MECDPEKFAILLIVSQITASLAVDHLSEEILQILRTKLKSFRWEKEGEIYQHYFRIKAWKDKMPELGNQFSKDHMESAETEYLNRFIIESVRAELCHELALILSIPLILHAGQLVIEGALLYSLLANIPFCMIQRYNRPRLEKLQEQREKKPTQPLVATSSFPLLFH
jgi:glycosyl-4,4'-diaponeurosporenoate acyltransferase